MLLTFTTPPCSLLVSTYSLYGNAPLAQVPAHMGLLVCASLPLTPLRPVPYLFAKSSIFHPSMLYATFRHWYARGHCRNACSTTALLSSRLDHDFVCLLLFLVLNSEGCQKLLAYRLASYVSAFWSGYWLPSSLIPGLSITAFNQNIVSSLAEISGFETRLFVVHPQYY